jgi:cell division protein DivIC
MENPFKNTSWFKIISNKYILITLFFIIWMLFLDNYSYLDYRYLNNQENALEDNKTYYQQEIEKDTKNIKLIKNPDQIEKYAREKYFMKKDSEDVYIIEFEGDTINKENR